jgi:2-furoate---CoA ligase
MDRLFQTIEGDMDLATTLSWTAERYPHRRAVGGPAPLTYREWDARTNQVARALARAGARPADRVVLLMQGGEPLATLHLAAQKLGVASVPLSIRFAPAEAFRCIEDCGPTLVVVDVTTADRVPAELEIAGRRIPVLFQGPLEQTPPGMVCLPELVALESEASPEAAPATDAISVMLYTSGTTGRPKGVPRTHAAEHAAAVAHVMQSGHRPGEVTLGVMPLFHTMGLRSLLASIVTAGTWVPQATFDAEQSLELITREQVSALYLVPTIYWSLLRTGRLADATSVRRLGYAGAAMTPALAEQLVAAVQPERFINHFGSTEIYTFTVGPDVAAKPGCAGRAGMFSRVRLVDPTPGACPDLLVAAGEQGQVAVSMSSPEAFAGYWNRPDADAAAIRDGWYFTGDLATADEDGDLWVSGRVDDMINSGGENIYPDEIEDALVRCPAVDEVIVVGLPDDRWGSAVTAFVVPRTGADPDKTLAELDRYLRTESGLPSLKRPKRLVAVDVIPKSAVGKILRRELVDGKFVPLAEAAVTSSSQEPQS